MPISSQQEMTASDVTPNAQREFWSTIAERYDAVADLMAGKTTRHKVLARLTRPPALGRVVEFACGTGYNTAALAQNASRVTATDFSPGMLAIARTRVFASNVVFRVEDCCATTFANDAFDTAVFGLVLHLAEPKAALREARRIVRPGGRLIVINPGLASLAGPARALCRARMIYYGITRHRRKPPAGFSEHLLPGQQLCELIEQHGWKNTRMETIPSSSWPCGLPLEYIEAAG